MTDLKIFEASPDNIVDIQKIAEETWPVTFVSILSSEQIRYMMNWMYSSASLTEQFSTDNRYFLARSGGKYLGFMSIENNYQQSARTKIHKAYILPSAQRKGIGAAMFDIAISEAIKSGDEAICLNVNKNNKQAIAFYEKYGMKNIKAEVIDIGNGFVMDDYVFEKKVFG